jgi:hypothetical protein
MRWTRELSPPRPHRGRWQLAKPAARAALSALTLVLVLAACGSGSDAPPSNTAPPTELGAAGEAPANPYAADSPWPHFHRNSYAQAASPLPGPQGGDTLRMQHVDLPDHRGGTPTQMHISERYPDGSRTVWSTTLTSLVKARVAGESFELADIYTITPRALDFNVHWNMQLGRGNKAFVPDPNNRSILRFGDTDPQDPRSKIALEARFTLPAQIAGATTVINMSHDGWIVFLTNQGWVGAVTQDFSAWRAFNIAAATGDSFVHNSFPIDEQGNIYFGSYGGIIAVRWDGDQFRLLWRSSYDFRGEGCPPPAGITSSEVIKTLNGESCTGSGTTPTLMGRGSMDKLVLAVDSHAPNNLVAFWRDEIPADWPGLPGRDRRVAGVIALPHSTWEGEGFTAENSPPAWGYQIAVAQYRGFTPGCSGPSGVQMLRWDPADRELKLEWANADVHFNNVMTISASSNLLYGIGRAADDCRWTYRGLDLATGAEAFALPLDSSNRFADGGNTHALNDDRSIVFGVPNGIARLLPSGAR